MPMLGVSFPSTKIPLWNVDEGYNALENAFAFAVKHLQDNASFIVIYSHFAESNANIVGLS